MPFKSKSKSKNTPQRPSTPPVKKFCQFCEKGTTPDYTDSATLKRFMSDRSRIVSRQRSGVCSLHQRLVSKEIKHARHLALLPFVPSI